jgi:hypothetical protein
MDTNKITIITPNTEQIREQCNPLVVAAENLEIGTISDHEDALRYLKEIRTIKKAVKTKLEPIIGNAYKAHKGLTSLRAELLGPLNYADLLLNNKMNDYEAEQRAIAEKAQETTMAGITVMPEIAKVEGISSSKKYKVVVRDIVMLAQFVVDNPHCAGYLEPNMSMLNALARAQQHELRIPGVEVIEETSRSVRTA